MATSTKNKSNGKEKCRTSSTPNPKPSPHYLKPTISFAMDICTYPAAKHTANVPSDDTLTPKHSSRTARKPIEIKSPSPSSQLKKTLSISPKGSAPSRKSFSPRSVPERGFKVPSTMRNGKEEPLVKGASVKKTTNVSANGREERPGAVKGGSVKKNTNATTRPKTGTKAATSTTTVAATTTATGPKKKKLVKRKDGDKAAVPVKDIQEEVVDVVEEKTIQVESPPGQDHSGSTPVENADDLDSTILSEEDELIKAGPEADNQEAHETEDDVTGEPEQTTDEQPEGTNIQDEPKAEEKEKETLEEEETTEAKGAANNSQSEEQKPHKLKFRPGKQLGEKEVGSSDELNLQRIKFKERKDAGKANGEGKSEGEAQGESENVVLKKQDVQEKKESPVANDVIEETANKLVEKRKSKVKALVGAFETVMHVEQETEE